MNAMAQRIKWLRKEKCRITLEELAKKAGISKATAQRYENGIIPNIPEDKIEALAEALETTPGFIKGWESDPEKFRLDNRFGRLLKKERESLNMSPSDFAAYIGISEDALARYESGSSIPSINVALPIAVQLGISIDQYDPMVKPKVSDLDKEIIHLLSTLSQEKKLMALAYIQGMKDTEGKKASPPSVQSSTRPTVP